MHGPIVQEANDACGIPSLVADLCIRGIWQPQTVALFDIRVIDTALHRIQTEMLQNCSFLLFFFCYSVLPHM